MNEEDFLINLASTMGTLIAENAALRTELAELKQRWPKIGRRELWDLADIPDEDRRLGLFARRIEDIGVVVQKHYSDVLSDD